MQSCFLDLKRGIHTKNRLAILNAHNAQGAETLAISNAFDLENDRDIDFAGSEEIAVQRVARSFLDGLLGGRQGLR